MKELILLTCCGSLLWAASDMEAGKKEMQRACLPCHSLRLVESQRLSSAAWGKELDKMIGWGAEVKDKQALLDYLSAEYSNAKPLATPETTRNGSTQKQPPK